MALFENNQWAVTDWGLTSLRKGALYEYEIAAGRLLETANQGGKKYDWPSQIAEKTWADLEAFLEAYNQAIVIHHGKYKGDVDPAMMADSVTYARQIAVRAKR